MKIRSIDIIDYKSFLKFSWQKFFNNAIFHENMNIIYGENGTGKTAVCNILKSLSNHEDFVVCCPKKAVVKCDNIVHTYSEQNWDKKLEKNSIIFFDKEFVNKNIHLGGDRGKKQGEQAQESGKLIIEFDAEAIKLRKEVDNLKAKKDEEKKKLDKFNEENKDILNSTLSDFEKKFFAKYKDKDVKQLDKLKQKLIERKERVNKTLKIYRANQKEIDSIHNIQEIDIHNISKAQFSSQEKYQSLFNFDIEEEAKIDTNAILIKQIKEHKSFFEEGIRIRNIHPEKCPFCQSNKAEEQIKEIIKLYNDIYDDSYKKQLKNFEELKENSLDETNKIIQNIENFSLEKVFLDLSEINEEFKIKGLYSISEKEIFKKPELIKIRELKVKIEGLEKPNKENMKEIYKAAKKEIDVVNKFFDKLKEFINIKNKIIRNFKEDSTEQNLKQLIENKNANLSRIEQIIHFFNNDLIQKEKIRQKKKKEQDNIKNDYSDVKDKYGYKKDKYYNYCSSEIFQQLLSKIEYYFNKFNFNMKLKLTVKARATKEIPLNFEILDSEDKERDFKDGLSEGEYQVLSLCFFFAFLGIQKDDEKILVFDDPITSLDNNNLSSLVDLIYKTTTSEGRKFHPQVFIFTHHRTFFNFLRKKFRENNNEYNILKNKKQFGASFICSSKEEKFINRLKKLEENLHSDAQDKYICIESRNVEYGQFLRYELERFVKNNLLQLNEDKFSKIIEGLKKNKKVTNDSLDKISNIYSFCNWTTSHVDTENDYGWNQLKSKIEEFIKIYDNFKDHNN